MIKTNQMQKSMNPNFIKFQKKIIFFRPKINNNKIENEKKFTNDKLYGGKPMIVIAPNINGDKNITINLLFIKESKLKYLLLSK